MTKKLTVVTWDAGYRENMRDGLECLKKQTVLNQLECIHVEWGSTPNPILLEYDFIKVYCLNLPLVKRKSYPSFDTGIQYNFGLHIAETQWVGYHQFDIMARDFYEKILNKINHLESQNPKIIYLEGWQVNHKRRHSLAWRMKEYKKLKQRHGDDLDLLPYKYNGPTKQKPIPNGVGITVKKQDFINICGGWMWNVPHRSEWYAGPGHPQKKYKNKSLRQFLVSQRRILQAQKAMAQFAIPHPVTPNRNTPKKSLYGKGIKHYNNFVSEWLPAQHITLYKRGDK
jgi:hypothetical protein